MRNSIDLFIIGCVTLSAICFMIMKHTIVLEIEADLETESYSINQGKLDPPDEGFVVTGWTHKVKLGKWELDQDSIEEIVDNEIRDDFDCV